MTDQKLLELAAKAAGLNVKPHSNRKVIKELMFTFNGRNWNPLTDDGDALRLAVKLNLAFQVLPGSYAVEAWHNNNSAKEYYVNHEKQIATRRAIVRAAAQIAEIMK